MGQSFVDVFFQVARAEDPNREGDDPVIPWVGAAPREVVTVEDVARHLAPYADLPAAMAEQLRRDRAAKLGQAPTDLQQASLAALRRAR